MEIKDKNFFNTHEATKRSEVRRKRHEQSEFKNKRILITGGTGSIGQVIAQHLLKMPVKEIVIFSRDEQKHFAMSHKFENHKNLKFTIGDVRDFRSILRASYKMDIIYHAAAMKHVPLCEEVPMEAVRTNILGAFNVREAALQNNVKKVIVISTDKAIRPINVMGMTKSIQERIMLAETPNPIEFIAVRFGNVLGSKGSVIPIFVQKIREKKAIPLTHKDMTRFFMPIEDAIKLVIEATVKGQHGEIFVKKMPACKISDLAKAITESLTNNKNYPIETVGLRKGEQLFETLVSDDEMRRTEEYKEYFVISPAWQKEFKDTPCPEYRSDRIHQELNQKKISQLLKNTNVLKTHDNLYGS